MNSHAQGLCDNHIEIRVCKLTDALQKSDVHGEETTTGGASSNGARHMYLKSVANAHDGH